MRSWLKLTAIRVVVSLISLLIVIFLTLWLPGHSAKNLIKSQLDQPQIAVTKLNNAQILLSSLPVLSKVQTQQIGSIKAYADQAQKSADKFDALDLEPPRKINTLFGAGQLIKDTNQAVDEEKINGIYEISSQDIALADRVFDYHAAVSQALVNVLEYNPVEDTKNFDLKSDDTKQRLESARTGLLKADNQLQAAKKIFKDSSLDEVSAMVSRLRYARYNLSQNGETAAWISRVNDSQTRIVNNRTKFWAAESKSLTDKLQADSGKLQKTQIIWKNLAAKYNVR